jgi:hypothetical protein
MAEMKLDPRKYSEADELDHCSMVPRQIDPCCRRSVSSVNVTSKEPNVSVSFICASQGTLHWLVGVVAEVKS